MDDNQKDQELTAVQLENVAGGVVESLAVKYTFKAPQNTSSGFYCLPEVGDEVIVAIKAKKP